MKIERVHMMSPAPIVICENLVKIYKSTDLEVVALQGLDLAVAPGEMMALVGASGSGKTTLLNVLGGLDTPSAGRCVVAGIDLTRLDDAGRTRFRRRVVGHIWQQSGRNLLPGLSIAANIDLPQVVAGTGPRERQRRTRELVQAVGLEAVKDRRPAQLSGGEQQRAALAVALSNGPALLLADEPTGELDSVTADAFMDVLHQINRQRGTTIILVTHDAAVAARTNRTIAIRDGRTSTETVRRTVPLASDTGTLPASAVVGLSGRTHREAILIDRAGRLQLPKDALERLPFAGRAEVRVLDDHVEIWPLSANTQEQEARDGFIPFSAGQGGYER
jgi:ABC-type lipoprotein export system ATPase subunit